ncbi:hypothetical protein CLD22_16095 [Rubrivivax gelatinosus]|nr:hypothetical protein [Rubrivivax gelatinosus]
MLRFQPDGWLEGLLRPLILIDPSAGIYFEESAPDWRFLVLSLFVLVAWLARRPRWPFDVEQTRTLLLLFVAFYVWTFVIGNARYFAFGLLLVGPLLVMTWRRMPGSRAFRATLMALAVGLQVQALVENYHPNGWGLSRWIDGPALAIEDSPLRHEPAVFLTATGISYSILVPAFHPQSRWANVSGQRDITPREPEYARLQQLLSSGLPRYLVAPIAADFMDGRGQPVRDALELYNGTLGAFGLKLAPRQCVLLRSTLAFGLPDRHEDKVPQRGFWICPVVDAPPSVAASARVGERALRVFAAIEERCPRFFQSGDGRDREFDGIASRHYGSSDMRLYLDGGDRVLFRYFRAINPTYVGTGSEVLEGRFRLPCDKVPGRYRLPWEQE